MEIGRKEINSIVVPYFIEGISMGEKIILTSPNCVGCNQLREHLDNLGLIHKYRVIDVSTKEGHKIAEKLGITHVPNCIFIENSSEGMRARTCTENEFLDLLKGK